MDRREFLLLRTTASRCADLSCERLYMRFVDAQAAGTVPQLFEALALDLAGVSAVRLTDRSWLSSAELRQRLDAVLAPFVNRGGQVR